MNLQYIKYAQEVERCGSINKAAQKLYITQPYLSYCLKTLEDDIGITMFTRSANGSVVTKDGKEFLDLSNKLIDESERIKNKYKKEETKKKYIYRIYCIRSAVAMNAFFSFLKRIKLKENYEFAFFETGMIEMIDSVYLNNADIGLAMFYSDQKDYIIKYIDDKNLNFQSLGTAPVYVTVSRNHALAKREYIIGKEMDEFTCATYCDYIDSVLNVLNECKLLGIGTPNKLVYVRDRHTLFNMLSLTDAYSVAHKFSAQDNEMYNLVSIPVKDSKSRACFGYVSRKNLNEIEIKNQEILVKCFKSHVNKYR